ncbi:MAG: DC1 domain-containing protein [Candidatus Hodarchaeota archaeon]
MLTPIGWFNGLFSLIIFLSGFVSGLFFIYQSRKTNAKLLFHAGMMLIFCFLVYSGSIIDFLAILLTNENIRNPYGIVGVLNWAPVFIGGAFFIYFNSELLITGRRKIKLLLLYIYIILVILIEIFIILGGIIASGNEFQPNDTFIFIYPENLGDDLIDVNINVNSPVYILALIVGLVAMGYCGFGYFYKSLRSKGVVRKKFFLLCIAIFLYIPSLIIDGLVYFEEPSTFFMIYIKISVLSCSLLWYFGLREESVEPKKEKFKKETTVEGELFRLYKRPSQITEEEVTVSKEKKICLVCKGKLSGFNLAYICSNCDTLYCENCARALSDLENTCWVCYAPIDDSKPIKPFKGGETELVLSEETDKKLKVERSEKI